ncbi:MULTISPECIES: DUF6680 family protein [unclassified Sphingomonas]|uniref:DUF6680 family protein n=1 Tax=unclassified Sphingomonas TaxID=196159 RepID=UPI000FF0B6DF|nr:MULTISPECIES: DUF6680 family protein [unclassified Sphingomonas]RKE53395.1 hypothetical protein C8J39_0539 [Sphingomonas sp. PP-CC-1A-547]TCM09890.1 hypothetical protein C8J41_101396 [Sphingomonas sp. PP-CC-3G-468]
MSLDTWTNPAVLAAFLSAVAAIAAAVATWRAPVSAARIAEILRRQGDNEMESRRFKLNVFALLMQGRAELASEDTVRALNSIDVAFNKSVPVREAWAELFQAFGIVPMQNHLVDKRVRKLLREMAQDLGIADTLRLDDFARTYFPNALAQDREMRSLQRQATLKQLTGSAAPEQNIADPAASLWPPKPVENKL